MTFSKIMGGVLLFAASLLAQYSNQYLVDPAGTSPYTTINSALQACGQGDCEIIVKAGTYNEKVLVTGDDIWLHGEDPDNLPVVRWLDSTFTYPRKLDASFTTNPIGSGSNPVSNWALDSEKNGVIQVFSAERVRISHLKIDGVRKYPWQWTNFWGSTWQFFGNAGVMVSQSSDIRIDHCDISNTWYGINLKDRNLGGVFANADAWEEQSGLLTAPFSNFGRFGRHLIEYNRIHDNVWALHTQQAYDLGSIFRYNLTWNNYSVDADFSCHNDQICGVPDEADGNRRYHGGGFMYLSDVMLVAHNIYGNTSYNDRHFLAGFHKAGKNHNVYNNIIGQTTRTLNDLHLVGNNSEVFGGYSNATNNVLSSHNGATEFPLFGGHDALFTAANLNNNGAAPIDSFETPLPPNWYYDAVDFQSTTPSNANFLCPDWSNASVQRTIAGKGWDKAQGHVGAVIDVGALWQDGSNCREGGSQDPIQINISALSPVIFLDQTNARIQFEISATGIPDSLFTNVRFHYTAQLDSVPFGNIPTSTGAFPTISTPVASLIGGVNMGFNDKNFNLQRLSLGEYGLVHIVVEAEYNGVRYLSNLEIFEYRRLDYLLDIKFFSVNDLTFSNPLDTVKKGDTLNIVVRTLDLNLAPKPTVAVTQTTFRALNFNSFSDPTNAAIKLSSLPDFTGRLEVRTVVTGQTSGNEQVTITGYAQDGVKRSFTSGLGLVYILPSDAEQLRFGDVSSPKRGDTITVEIDVLDVFGQISDDDVQVMLTSSDPNIAKVIQGTLLNNDGILEFRVVLLGDIGDDFTLTADLLGPKDFEVSEDFTIGTPDYRIMLDPLGPTAAPTGSIVPVRLWADAINGSGPINLPPGAFYLNFNSPAGSDPLRAYVDSTLTTPLSTGQAYFNVGINGTDTLYFSVPANATQGGAYSVQTSGTQSFLVVWDDLDLIFDVPTLVFLDGNGDVLDNPPPIDEWTGVYVEMSVQAMLGNTICTGCTDIVSLITADPNLGFKTQLGTPDIAQIQLVNGKAEFLMYGKRQVTDATVTLSGRGGAMTVIYDEITFNRPPVPQADSVLVFDQNGDGIADSIVAYYEVGRDFDIHDSLPSLVQWVWPSDIGVPGSRVPTQTNTMVGNNHIVKIAGSNLTTEIMTQGIGNWISTYPDPDGGADWLQNVDIIDRIGPVIKSINLIQGFGTNRVMDSLIVTFSEPIDPESNFDFPSLASQLNAFTGGFQAINDSQWVFTTTAGQIKVGDDIKITSYSGIRDLAGNAPHPDNPFQEVGLIRRPIPTSQNGNMFQDLDGDGTLDHVVLKFLAEPSREYLDNDLDSVVFIWHDMNGDPIRLVVPGKDFIKDPNDTTQVFWNVPDPSILQPFLTYIAEGGDYGTAMMYTSLVPEPREVNMTDDMPPVIKFADLDISEKDNGTDKLKLEFSEPIDPNSIPPGFKDAEFEFIRRGETEPRTVRYSDIDWNDDFTEATLSFSSNIGLSSRPNSQDSIRVRPGALADQAGIFVGANSRYKLIEGESRILIMTVPSAIYDPEDPTLLAADPIEIGVFPLLTNRSSLPYLGIGMQLGGAELKSDIQRRLLDKLYGGDSTLLRDTITVDPSKIHFKLGVDIFSNIGGFVAAKTVYVDCDDALFTPGTGGSGPGNCLIGPDAQGNEQPGGAAKFLFLQWNFKSETSRFVGSGAYIFQYQVKVWYETKNITITEKNKSAIWGVKRGEAGAGNKLLD
jgi:hypothetical protein